MADVHSKAIRSYNMSQIKGKDTTPEILVRKYLFAEGFRYRIHQNKLPGKPDLVFPKLKKIVFIHGCYWHGHEKCKYFVPPKTRTKWWLKKIDSNKKSTEKTTADIKATQVELTTAENSIKGQQEVFNKRVRAMYINGADSYLGVILESDNLGDFVSRVDTIKKIVGFDEKTINESD